MRRLAAILKPRSFGTWKRAASYPLLRFSTAGFLLTAVLASISRAQSIPDPKKLESENFIIDFSEVPDSECEIGTHDSLLATCNPKKLIDGSTRLLPGSDNIYDLAEEVATYSEWARVHYMIMGYADPTLSAKRGIYLKDKNMERPASGRFSTSFPYFVQYKSEPNRTSRISTWSFHECFHAVQYAEAEFTVVMNVEHAPWVYEGTAVWAEAYVAYKQGIANQHSATLLQNCIPAPYVSVFTQFPEFAPNDKGYGTGLLWSYLQYEAEKKGQDLVRAFWSTAVVNRTWFAESCLRDVLNKSLGLTLEDAFRNYLAANYFQSLGGTSYYPPYLLSDNNSKSIGVNFKKITEDLGSRRVTAPVSFTSAAPPGRPANLEKWSGEYFVVSDSWEGSLVLTIKTPTAGASSLFALVFHGGNPGSKASVGVLGSPTTLTNAQAKGAVIIVARTEDAWGPTLAYSVDFAKGPDQLPTGPQGMLDVVLCIDTTGSMTDDIDAVKKTSKEIITQLSDFGSANNISLQYGLITYQDHTDAQQFPGTPSAAWLRKWPMTSSPEAIRNNIFSVSIAGIGIGGDPAEDLYAALLCAMDSRPDWQNVSVPMGWRPGAAKIIIPMSDAPPHDPDFEGHTLPSVAARAEQLDPVHVYPLLLPKSGLSFLDPAVSAMEQLAAATGGQVSRVSTAAELPKALVTTVKTAVQRHREEVWRKEHPPYALYITAAALGLIVVAGVVFAIIFQNRGPRPGPPGSAKHPSRLDPTLTGEASARLTPRPESTPKPRRSR